ncbi:MAG TPA: hypothetical protein VEC38_14130 [Candidatus Binataceae bacterium]|nr:hypothetical protein [Candidatus Binataceae bacterium]
MILAQGEYRYEIRRAGDLIAIEEERVEPRKLSGVRRSPDGANRHEVRADLDDEERVLKVTVRYERGPFARMATYEASGEFLRGRVSALAGSNDVTVKLGRFREIDADLVLFRALTIGHIRARGEERWTGRVATIDPNTLVATLQKQSCRRRDGAGRLWVYEPRMGDVEEIEIDADGRIVRRRDSRGTETVLISASGV